MRAIIDRLKEPSTYAGLAGILGALGIAGFSSEEWATLVAVPMAIAAAIAVILREPKVIVERDLAGRRGFRREPSK